MDIKLIIFDFDGTLGDTRRNIVMTLQQTMRTHNLAFRNEATCAATIGLTLDNCFRRMYPQMDEAQVSECMKTYRQLFEENRKKLTPKLFPSISETLSILHKMGLTMSVASSRNSKSLIEFLEEMGIAKYMSFVIAGDNVEKGKPDPEPVLKTLSALGMNAGETLVVGDMPVDIKMGKTAKTITCGVTWGNATREELQAAEADYIIEEMPELAKLIKQ